MLVCLSVCMCAGVRGSFGVGALVLPVLIGQSVASGTTHFQRLALPYLTVSAIAVVEAVLLLLLEAPTTLGLHNKAKVSPRTANDSTLPGPPREKFTQKFELLATSSPLSYASPADSTPAARSDHRDRYGGILDSPSADSDGGPRCLSDSPDVVFTPVEAFHVEHDQDADDAGANLREPKVKVHDDDACHRARGGASPALSSRSSGGDDEVERSWLLNLKSRVSELGVKDRAPSLAPGPTGERSGSHNPNLNGRAKATTAAAPAMPATPSRQARTRGATASNGFNLAVGRPCWHDDSESSLGVVVVASSDSESTNATHRDRATGSDYPQRLYVDTSVTGTDFSKQQLQVTVAAAVNGTADTDRHGASLSGVASGTVTAASGSGANYAFAAVVTGRPAGPLPTLQVSPFLPVRFHTGNADDTTTRGAKELASADFSDPCATPSDSPGRPRRGKSFRAIMHKPASFVMVNTPRRSDGPSHGPTREERKSHRHRDGDWQ